MEHIEGERCSYCQREYGTKGVNGKPLYKTFDHIIPLYWPKEDKTRNSAYETYSLEELKNIIDSCNECNKLKGSNSLGVFVLRVQCRYNKKVSERVRISVNILSSTPNQLIPLDYLI